MQEVQSGRCLLQIWVFQSSFSILETILRTLLPGRRNPWGSTRPESSHAHLDHANDQGPRSLSIWKTSAPAGTAWRHRSAHPFVACQGHHWQFHCGLTSPRTPARHKWFMCLSVIKAVIHAYYPTISILGSPFRATFVHGCWWPPLKWGAKWPQLLGFVMVTVGMFEQGAMPHSRVLRTTGSVTCNGKPPQLSRQECHGHSSPIRNHPKIPLLIITMFTIYYSFSINTIYLLYHTISFYISLHRLLKEFSRAKGE